MKDKKNEFVAKWMWTSKGPMIFESEFRCFFCKKIESIRAVKKPILFAEQPFAPVLYAAERAGWILGFVELIRRGIVKEKSLFAMCPKCVEKIGPEGSRSEKIEAIKKLFLLKK